ncbi:M14 family zinc carboxypeptidase [Lysobacter brunescens]|uniref:M14 family zinc carboxypeptidase n=1 Tax=Lysobacter brunescens TaxID=262323 RepID=A0ABW2YCV4_9GAMM
MRYRSELLSALLLLSVPVVASTQTIPSISPGSAEDASSVVVIRYRTQAELQQLGDRFQHVHVDRRARTVRADATGRDIAQLRAAGMAVTIDRDATLALRRSESAIARSGFGTRSISGYSCYRTVEETYTTLNQLTANKPALVSVSNIGSSWLKTRGTGGYDLKVLRLTNSATNASRPNKPAMVLTGGMHPREYAPVELVTRFGEWLVNGYGTDAEATWLMDNYVFYIVLQSNPDGRKKAEAGASWRKNVNNTNGSCSASSFGVDLNRNFPFQWNSGSGGSSGSACAETYRGPSRQSEPETQALVRLIAGTPGASGAYSGGIFPDLRADGATTAAPDTATGMYIDVHAYGQLVMWPWGYTSSAAPNGTALRTLGRRVAYHNSAKPQTISELYTADGSSVDTIYGLLGTPSLAFELGNAFFEGCSSFESSVLPRNLAALKYAARTLSAPYRYPSGPDSVSVTTSSASVPAGTAVTITAVLDDTRFNQTNGTEASQAIASARMYVDTPPWQSGATAIAMSASDGSFNSSRETVTASLNTSGLSAGRHIVYVQGVDASGLAGAPNAVIVNVTGGGGGNVAPIADFTSTAPTASLSVTFTDRSSDSDGSIASRSWDFGDGTTSTQASPTKTYASAGTYTIKLTVTDNGGLSHTKTETIAVGTSTPPPQTYSNGTDYAINDNATVESPVTVANRPGNAPTNASVAVNILHTFRGDLRIDLVAPDGSVYLLKSYSSSDSADNVNATYTVNLSSEALNGTWKLRVNDNAANDTGRIDSWSVTF